MSRGIILHALAKVIFICSSYVIHFYLGKYLSPNDYGAVGIIISIINFGYLFLNNGVRQAISKGIARKVYNNEDVIKKGLAIQTAIVIVTVLITFVFSNIIANILGDISLAPYIRFTSFIIPFMGIYFAMLGAFNGNGLFEIETGILMVYPILKLSIIPFVHWGNNPVINTEMGFLFAAVMICIVCGICLCKNLKAICSNCDNRIGWSVIIKSSMAFSSIFICASAVMNVDLLILKSTTSDLAIAGYYTGAMNFSKIPYYLLTAVFLVMLPVVTNLYEQKRLTEARNLIGNIVNLILAVIFPLVITISAKGVDLLRIFYSKGYEVAYLPLILLLFGTSFLGITILFNMIISSTESKRFTLGISITFLISDVIVCILLSKQYGMLGTALCNFCCSGIFMLLSFVKVWKLYGWVLNREIFYPIVVNIFSICFFKGIDKLVVIENFFQLLLFYGISYLGIIGIEFALGIISLDKIKGN